MDSGLRQNDKGRIAPISSESRMANRDFGLCPRNDSDDEIAIPMESGLRSSQ